MITEYTGICPAFLTLPQTDALAHPELHSLSAAHGNFRPNQNSPPPAQESLEINLVLVC
jgi:hypothetical protein